LFVSSIIGVFSTDCEDDVLDEDEDGESESDSNSDELVDASFSSCLILVVNEELLGEGTCLIASIVVLFNASCADDGEGERDTLVAFVKL